MISPPKNGLKNLRRRNTQETLQNLERVLSFIRRESKDFSTLIEQGAFEDWQDSSRRSGLISYTNALLLAVGSHLAREQVLSQDQFLKLRRLFRETFFDASSGLYATTQKKTSFCLETQLLLLDEKLTENPAALWHCLKRHPLWTSSIGPGLPHYPRYEKRDISWTCQAVGLTGYHDNFVWSWLLGFSAKVALRLGDFGEAEKILATLESWAVRDQVLGEVYGRDQGELFQGWLFRSERPFSWGAGKVLEALELQK